MPVTWMKAKYSAPKMKGRYHSSHNDGGTSKRNKKGVKVVATRQRVLTLTSSGKRAWSWRSV